MKKLDYDNGFSYLALAVVLFGVFAAAQSALAGDTDDDHTRLPARVEQADEVARQEAMAEDAVDALERAVTIDLDIKIADHMSTASATRR